MEIYWVPPLEDFSSPHVFVPGCDPSFHSWLEFLATVLDRGYVKDLLDFKELVHYSGIKKVLRVKLIHSIS